MKTDSLMKCKFLLYIIIYAGLSACTKPEVPKDFRDDGLTADIYPDYADVTVPRNIAPLRFHIEEQAQLFVSQLSSGNVVCTFQGQDVCPSRKQWEQLRNASSTINVEIYLQDKEGWKRKKPFSIWISADEIDPYLAYRLISPSYVTYEDLTICQRRLSDYQEKVIYGNMINSTEKDAQCINCHAFQQQNPRRMQFHVRQHLGGTVISYDGQTRKVDLKTDSVLSAGVYPAWHPTEQLIAYSTNLTTQAFHTLDLNKVEVQDTQSALMLYDIAQNKVIPLPSDNCDLDCFPCWSPDGQWLYYCSAKYETNDSLPRSTDILLNYEALKYNLYRRSFDTGKNTFGPKELVYDAAAIGQSATLPRISPDGRWLMFTQGAYGVFHIWHNDADLYLIDLQNGNCRIAEEINSPQVESYHSWSSNGKWVVFSSRRDDGNFTRPFFAHFDNEGSMTKPFELPSEEPEYHRQLMRSYNVPEFIVGPVEVSPQELAEIIKQDAVKSQ